MSLKIDWVIRDYREEDLPFLLSSWSQSLKHGSEVFERMEDAPFYQVYFDLIKKMITRSRVKIAALKEDPEIILGYSIFKGDRLHYVYIKEAWRKKGILKELLPPVVDRYTHFTKAGEAMIKKHHAKAFFNPFQVS